METASHGNIQGRTIKEAGSTCESSDRSLVSLRGSNLISVSGMKRGKDLWERSEIMRSDAHKVLQVRVRVGFIPIRGKLIKVLG